MPSHRRSRRPSLMPLVYMLGIIGGPIILVVSIVVAVRGGK